MGILEIRVYFEKMPQNPIDIILDKVKQYIQFPIKHQEEVDKLSMELSDFDDNKSEEVYFDVFLSLYRKEYAEESTFDKIKRRGEGSENNIQIMQTLFGNQLYAKGKGNKDFDIISITTTNPQNYLFEVVLLVLIEMGGKIKEEYLPPQ